MAEPRQEMGHLATALLEHARELLSERGSYYPFGAVMAEGERAQLIGFTPSAGDPPTSATVLEHVYREIERRRDDAGLRAIGVCTDVRIPAPAGEGTTDAIRVSLEHVASHPLDVFLPWERQGDEIAFGEMFSTPGDRRVFG